MICAVIPTLKASDRLGPLLKQLRPHVERIVITDSGSDDTTLTLATQSDARLALGSPGRGKQLRRGCDWAQNCDWLLILHSDCQLTQGWERVIKHHIENHPDEAGYFDLKFDSRRLSARLAEALVRLRCWAWGLPYGDQGLFISRGLYNSVGGYPDFPLFEDVALIEALGKKRIRRLKQPILTFAARHEHDGYILRGWKNLRLLRRFHKGDNIQSLLQHYQLKDYQ